MVVQQKSELQQNCRQDVVVTVRDPAGQLAHRLHLLGLLQLRLQAPAFGDVPEVALDHPPGPDVVDVADEFDVNLPPILSDDQQVLMPETPLSLEGGQSSLGGGRVLEQARVPEALSNDLLLQFTKYFQKSRIRVNDMPRRRIENHNPILGCLEQASVMEF